jgi:hypothetical protein
MLSVIMLSVIMLSVIMLSFMAPLTGTQAWSAISKMRFSILS